MNQKNRNFITCHLIMLLLFATGAPQNGLTAEEEHWSYSAEDGPEKWANLSADFDMCSKGRNQSPIDLSGTLDADLPELIFNYSNPGVTDEINNGHTVLVSLKPGNFVSIQGRQYEAKQFHFHSPSEHTID